MTAAVAREDVYGAAYWLYDLYFAAGGLRQLKRGGNEVSAAGV